MHRLDQVEGPLRHATTFSGTGFRIVACAAGLAGHARSSAALTETVGRRSTVAPRIDAASPEPLRVTACRIVSMGAPCCRARLSTTAASRAMLWMSCPVLPPSMKTSPGVPSEIASDGDCEVLVPEPQIEGFARATLRKGSPDHAAPPSLSDAISRSESVRVWLVFSPSPHQGCLPARNGHKGHLTASQSLTSLAW